MWEIFKFSINMIFKNKVRSLLTMLGIIVGILSLIVIVVLGNSFSDTFTNITNVLYKSDQIYVEIVPSEDNNNVIKDEYGVTVIPENVYLDVREVSDMLEKDMEGDSYLALGDVLEGTAYGTYNGKRIPLVTFGSGEDEVSNSALGIVKGRDISRSDEIHFASTCLIADVMGDYLFDGEDPIGQTLVLEYNSAYIPLVIVGTYNFIGIVNHDDPSQSMSLLFVNHTYLEEDFNEALPDSYWHRSYLKITLKNVSDKAEFKENLTKRLDKMLDQSKWTVDMFVQSEEINSIKEIVQIILDIVFVIACISLLIGGIGIMNVMLITVTERTSEIGVRKALGATDFIIMFQFLCESFMLSFSGTALGVILGMIVSKVVAEMGSMALETMLKIPVQINVSLPLNMLLFSAISSIVIGVIFGLYPAYKAVRMQVVDALRYE